MLRKRSGPVKQTINNLSSPLQEKPNKPSSSFLLNSPRIFQNFFMPSKVGPTPKIMSPSSVLETRPFSSSSTFPKIQNPKPFSWEKPGIGLALIHDHGEAGPTKASRQKTKLVVFGSQLKIQIPSQPNSPSASPQSPMEFGIKTPKSNFLNSKNVEQVKKTLSVEDMELSEDYTCVISHGPNPKTTHIFGNLIVESCSDSGSSTLNSAANGFFTGVKVKDEMNGFTPRSRDSFTAEDFGFLSFCHHCRKKIGQGEDIYMYRGEKAFCSQECRGQEMLFDGIES